MEKVRLDKTILIKEKLDTIWGSSNYKEVKNEIERCKQKRQEVNIEQREAYLQLLKFLKERRGPPGGTALPVAEEKQILDAIKIVLENGYCLGDFELLEIFDLIGLKGGLPQLEDEDQQPFKEFIYYLGRLFKVDMDSLK